MPSVKGTGLSKYPFWVFSGLCCLVYFTSYITRHNFMAGISEIVQSLQVSNPLAGMAVVGGFVTYGIGQPICGFLGDRIPPRIMITAGLLFTGVCNLMVSAAGHITMMIVLWWLNGFFQAMLWPPLLRIMAQTLAPEQYRKASVAVVAAASAGTIAVYVLVPVSIVISGWRLFFLLPGVCSLGMAAVWFVSMKPFRGQASPPEGESRSDAGSSRPPMKLGSLIRSSGLIPIMLVIVLQGSLRDGIYTWMPSYINDIYQLGTSVSILSTAILPLFAIFCVAAATYVQRFMENEIKTAAWIWSIGFVAASVLLAVYDVHAVLSVLFMALLTGCMHGVNVMLISLVPMHFATYGRVSTVSGLLNAFAYAGSAISIYGFAVISDACGWKLTILSWSLMALAGTVLCAACIGRWRRFAYGRGEREQSLY